MTTTTNQEEWTSKTRNAGEPVAQLWADPDLVHVLLGQMLNNVSMRHAPPPGKKGGGPNWAHSTKNHSHAHTLSLPPPRTGGKEKRERESNREKENPHTHTRAHERAGQTGVAGQ